jgi:glucose/arabinose dehydrogenase
MAADGTVCVVVGDATREGAGFSTLRCTGGLVADLEAYERAANPDGREFASNPYDVAWDGDDGWYVSDAAANAVLHADSSGRIRTVAVLASMAPFGGRPAQGVPTGLARAADGTLYVALFGGAPATGGPAVVVALRPDPDGGRTRPAAVARAVAPIGVAPIPQGLAVLDYGGGPADRRRGRLLLVDGPADPGTVAATGLDRPVGIARLPDGRYVVAETDSSRLRLVTPQ